jgi:HD-GYP domain-containing protein (c-di-GMP phosphodiesterase class II)
LAEAAEIVYAHQEAFDGSGYPRGLQGEQIPLGARIFAVADTLDAITSDRPYRKASTFEQAIEEIERCGGSQFDPAVLRAFKSISCGTWETLRAETSQRCRALELVRAAA